MFCGLLNSEAHHHPDWRPQGLDPCYLVESEVETMAFAPEEAGLPVPRVFCFERDLFWLAIGMNDANEHDVIQGKIEGIITALGELADSRNARGMI